VQLQQTSCVFAVRLIFKHHSLHWPGLHGPGIACHKLQEQRASTLPRCTASAPQLSMLGMVKWGTGIGSNGENWATQALHGTLSGTWESCTLNLSTLGEPAKLVFDYKICIHFKGPNMFCKQALLARQEVAVIPGRYSADAMVYTTGSACSCSALEHPTPGVRPPYQE
jgi:hypothetical protein